MLNRTLLLDRLPWAALGILLGVSTASAYRTKAGPTRFDLRTVTSQATSGQTAEFTVSLEPTAIIQNSVAGEVLEMEATVATTARNPVRSMVSVTVTDDAGNAVQPRVRSAALRVEGSSQVPAASLMAQELPDGWYHVAANAVFLDPAHNNDMVGAEEDALYLHVEDGETFFMDENEWHAQSRASEARQ
jgi:hypothetical protein